jgi:predicted ribosome quality control (RQC) complex YloA/Tae2 family protein
MSDSELERVVHELDARLRGVRPANVWQPTRDAVVLGFQDGTLLLLVPRGPDARLHSVVRRPTNPQRPFSFQGACRSHLSAPLDGIDKQPGERLAVLRFGRFHLRLGLTGRSGGLWLIDQTDGVERVVAAYDGPAPTTLPDLPDRPPRADPPRFQPGPDGSWDLAAALYFERQARERREHELRVGVERGVHRALQRALKLQANLEGDLAKAERAGEVREQADTLAGHLHEVVRGPDHVDLPAWDDPTRTIRVPLVPELSPPHSMDRLYQKARRLDRMGELVLDRLDAAGREVRRLRAVQASLAELDLDALAVLRAQHSQLESRRAPQATRTGVVTWTGPQGQRVLVGRDARANRRLSFQIARGTDWWMHLRGKAGAHLVLPMDRGRTPPLELLLAAAQIALVHGGMSVGERAEVQYTRARDVRSIPGSDGAQVLVHGETVLQVVRDPAALIGWERD